MYYLFVVKFRYLIKIDYLNYLKNVGFTYYLINTVLITYKFNIYG